ncbi:MAG: Na(+)-translocating NADH-quinone reductase subunit A [Oceanospirillaceae bacterium]|nr:Na(+)-translocating NADH-quinone reductase subunit A [Oceanospirillaceae bacterium]MCP5350595.1 Na(+)-translocating NADH-quinone reductase subunit A [Oceanospirillaceae bacterium]
MIKIKKGLDLPISGGPEQRITDGKRVSRVALVGADYVGMKPTMLVQEGDRVKKGQALFTDKKTPGVVYTAPAAGVVKEINRGERRVFLSLVIEIDGDASESFSKYDANQLATLGYEKVQDNLIKSGLWTALRTRPFSKVPAPGSKPRSVFVTAMDTNPLAADPQVIIAEHKAAFVSGLEVLSNLTEGNVFVCKAPGANIPVAADKRIVSEEFSGPHPAGLAGTHIHFLDPASASRVVWSIGYQDVIAIGQLFTTGELNSQRVVSLAGPVASEPRLVRTQVGADLAELTAGETSVAAARMISGSVFGGTHAKGAVAFLGRYANQVTLLEEGTEREFLHYMRAGFNRHSVLPIYISKFLPKKRFAFTTTTNGSERAMVPVGSYERIMPLDILPTQLLRALIVEDMDVAIALGALELSEEDLALCTYVCPGKYEYGPILRANLERIEKEA